MALTNDILDARQAAKYLRINEQTVRRLAREREIPSFKVGGVWRFKVSSLDSWAEAQISGRERKRVLVVEDEADMSDLLRRILEKSFFVSVARTGEDALAAMRSNLPDMVLLDLKLPGMQGPDVLAQIRQAWGDLPVVILTGYPESDLVNQALEYSPITLLSKTASNEQIMDAIQSAVVQA